MIAGTGVVGAGDLQVSANGTPNMSVNVAAGFVWCPGTLGSTAGMQANANAQTTYGLPSSLTAQGSYGGYNDGTVNLTIAAADPTNPRIDLICASIQDAEYAGSNNQPVLQVVTGSPAPSPSAPAAPASSEVLAQVAVAAGATSIVAGNITSTRTFVKLRSTAAFTSRSTLYGTVPSNPSWVVQSVISNITTDSAGRNLVTFQSPFPNALVAASVSNLLLGGWGAADAVWTVDATATASLTQVSVHAVKASTGANYATSNLGFSLTAIGC